MQERLNTIQTFFEANSDQKIKDKYARYFKHDLNCYGIDTNVFKNQKEVWLKEWKEELNFDGFMALSDELVNRITSYNVCYTKLLRLCQRGRFWKDRIKSKPDINIRMSKLQGGFTMDQPKAMTEDSVRQMLEDAGARI